MILIKFRRFNFKYCFFLYFFFLYEIYFKAQEFTSLLLQTTKLQLYKIILNPFSLRNMYLNGYDGFFQPNIRPAERDQLLASPPPPPSSSDYHYPGAPMPYPPSDIAMENHPQYAWMRTSEEMNRSPPSGPYSGSSYRSLPSKPSFGGENEKREECHYCLNHLSECSYCHRVASFRLAHDTFLYLTIAVLAYMALRRINN